LTNISSKILKLEKRSGVRGDHGEYLELQNHLLQFVTNHIDPISHESISCVKLHQLISVANGFLDIILQFHWYPDLISVIATIMSELIFGRVEK